jgi:ATP-dependent helicase/nuclease subunit B
MDPFLHRLATALLDRHKHELDQIAVVLPGRRAGVHLRRYLSACAGTTIWSPELLNMGSFQQRLTGFRQGEGMEMLFMLHQAQVDLLGDAADPLPEFIQWAPVTLQDMSEVDSHLLDLDLLYRDLRSFHEIDDWSFRLGELSAGQQRLAQQWRTTGALHRRLHERMLASGTGTSGWIARRAAEDGPPKSGLPWKCVWFAGLNALDPATTKVARQLLDNGQAVMAWDADRHYLEDDDQEAGIFLRRSINDLGPGILPPLNEILQRPRSLHTVAVSTGVAQARWAAQHVASLTPAERAGTAIVLADENLLMPLLEALPQDAGPYNVTMGMPVTSLPIHGLVEAFLALHTAGPSGQAGYHHTAVERLLLHPFLHRGEATAAAIKALRESQRPRLDDETLCTLAEAAGMPVPPAMRQALLPVNGSIGALHDRIVHLLAWANEVCAGDRFALEQSFRMARIQQQLHQGLDHEAARGLDIRGYIALRTRLLREESIGFFGEPLHGTQIMGFLETRALDHAHVVVLGANDGVLPRTGGRQSWIPFEIRRAYNLPLHHDIASITAYHVNRIMHLADTVHLVYDTSGDTGSGGPTRYLEQWRHEVVGHSATSLTEHTCASPHPARNHVPISIPKDELVLSRLQEMGRRGFSPSAIATWLTCPLDLYFRYVLRIRALEEVDEKLGSDVLGNAVHDVMEHVFTPWVGRELVPSELLEQLPHLERLLQDRLAEQFPRDVLGMGHFRLRIEMAARAMSAYLQAESDRCATSSTIPLLLESEVAATLPGGMVIRGRCDRIDLREGIVHILDIKTGGVRPEQVEFKELDRECIVAGKRYGLQLLMYAWAYMTAHPEVDRVRAGIIPLQKASQAGGVVLKIEGVEDITRNMLPAITDLLELLVQELLDPGVPFTHAEESEYCTCCITA